MSGSVFVRLHRDPLCGLTKQELIDFLRQTLQGRATHAFLYGSFWTSDFNKYSDIDLLIVHDTKTPFVERAIEFSDLRDRIPSLEILVYTPAEFDSLTKDPSPGFWRSVTSSMHCII